MNIGDYQIQMFNDGRWCIQFYQKDISSHILLWVTDLPQLFDRIVDRELAPRRQCADLFRRAFSDAEAFTNDEAQRNLIYAMPSDAPPWVHDPSYPRTPENTLAWHLGAFVAGYNAHQGTSVRADEVLPYVIDMKGEFI